MATPESQHITQLLMGWSDGDEAAREQLMTQVYNELRRLARHYMRNERPGNTLQTTALVNEAYLRLIDIKNVRYQDRAHFFAIAARLMRRILIDHARARDREKRGGGAVMLPLNEVATLSQEHSQELLALDEALTKLTADYPHAGRVFELRFFGGMSVEETAEVLGISPTSVGRHWKFSRAWLIRELTGAV